MTNAHDPRAPHVRGLLFVAMLLTFVVALAVPRAFGDDATIFVLAYAGVRFLHLGLYVDAGRRGNASLSAIAGFGTTVIIGMELVAGAALFLLVTIGLWWTYFGHVADAAEERLRTHDQPVLAAADGYSYLHLLLVAGIIIFAVGAKNAVEHVADPLSDPARLAFCGGVALYLAGLAAFAWRMMGSVSVEKLLAPLACLVVFAVGSDLAAWATAALVVAVLALLVIREMQLAA